VQYSSIRAETEYDLDSKHHTIRRENAGMCVESGHAKVKPAEQSQAGTQGTRDMQACVYVLQPCCEPSMIFPIGAHNLNNHLPGVLCACRQPNQVWPWPCVHWV
jgi:hypothetical protein